MKSKLLWTLGVVNVVLLLGLFASRLSENQAVAQAGRPVDFLMIPGEVSGIGTGVVYIIDTSNGRLGAFAYENSNRQLNIMPPLDLARALEGARAGGGVGGRNR